MIVLEKVSSPKHGQDKKYLTQSNRSKHLFPKGWNSTDYGFYQYRVSKKLGFKHGIIRHKKDKSLLYHIQRHQVMPYMSGLAEEVAFGLLLVLYGVPFWLVAHGLGRDAVYWCFYTVSSKYAK